MPDTGKFLGETGQYLHPSFEMGTGIEYQVPQSGGGGISYAGIPWGTADYNLGRVYGDPMETNRPVSRHQFPFTGFKGERFLTPEENENNRLGLMNTGNLPAEIMLAELSEQQGNWMGSPYGNPEHYQRSPQGFEDYKRGVQGQAEKWGHGFLGLGGQEDATDQEIKDRLLQNIKNKQWEGDTPALKNFREWGLV
tara:strand:- start:306 stop:890 length:585 start_codon:yes stop_codon:yes gene_type:complete